MMNPSSVALITQLDPSEVRIIREIDRSDASSIFEAHMGSQKYALKLYHNNGDPGWTAKGRDLNRSHCEYNVYERLLASGACDSGIVPQCYGNIPRITPALFQPAFDRFSRDGLYPSGILLEYLPNAETLNCVDYSEALFEAIEGMRVIHQAGVLHQDVYPKIVVFVRETERPHRLVWIDFNVATIFDPDSLDQPPQRARELRLVRCFGEALKHDPAEGSPPNTKFY